MVRIDIRVSSTEKKIISDLASAEGVTLTEYIKCRLLPGDSFASQEEALYHCPQSDRYNYKMAALSMTNYLLLEYVMKHLDPKTGGDKVKESIERSMKLLESVYGYTKKEVKKDE